MLQLLYFFLKNKMCRDSPTARLVPYGITEMLECPTSVCTSDNSKLRGIYFQTDPKFTANINFLLFPRIFSNL